MEENRQTPKIRFKEFNDTWEQRKFADYGTVSMCKRIFKEETSDVGEVPFYKIGTFGSEPDAFITNEKYNNYKKNFSFPEKGDILLSASGTIGRIIEYNGEKAYFQDSNIVWLNHNNDIKNSFLKVLYPIVKWDGIEGSTIKRLYNSNFLNTSFNIPDTKEQEQIGLLFSTIDNLIALYQSKYDKLLMAKKSMLEKIFPQDNEKIPKWRFKDFAGIWEQSKYEDIGIPLSGGNLSYESLNDNGDKNCVLYGDLYTKYDCIIKNIKSKTFEKGNTIIRNDILFPQSTTVDAYSLISPACLNEKSAETSGVFVIRPYENINGNFICYYTKGNESQRRKLSTKAQGLTIVHMYYHSIKDEKIMIPVKNEQDKISKILLNLDNLITLHQSKLEKLNNIKKSLLEKMFV